MTIQEAKEKFERQYIFPLANNKVYGIGTVRCKDCNGLCLHTTVGDKDLLTKLPDVYEGYRLEKQYGEQPVAQSKPIIDIDEIRNEFQKIYGRQKGVYAKIVHQSELKS